jgi:putative endonuclease
MASESPSQPKWRRSFGSKSEAAAALFLEQLGYRIVERNYARPQGELDIVALDKQCLVFVEVRSTEGREEEEPAESVDLRKQRRLTNLALQYLQEHNLLDQSARFDVIVVRWPTNQQEPAITHYPDAFEASGRFQMFS